MPEPISPSLSADALLEGLHSIADVIPVTLTDDVARLALAAAPGSRPVLYLDIDSPLEDQCWAMLGALRALTLGAHAALDAKRIRHLRAVPS